VEAQGFMLPVIEAHAEYKKGASFEQEIVIETKIFEPPKARLKIQYDVKLKEGDDLLMKGYTIHAFTNRAGRPVKAPKHILNVINPYFN
jgi:acyl-CoA thioester hydrolase